MTTLGSGTNQIQPFATGVGANVETPTNWQADLTRQQGFQNGVANATQVNTAIRQASFLATIIGQFIADFSGAAMNDDGNVLNGEQNFINALSSILQPIGVYVVTDTGTANAITATSTPAPSAYSAVRLVVFKKSASPNTGAVTANFWGLGTVTMRDNTGADFASGALLGGSYYICTYDGSGFRVLGGATTYTNVTTLTANSGDMVNVVSGSGVVNFRTQAGTHYTTYDPNDRLPFGRASDDHAMYCTRTELITWLSGYFGVGSKSQRSNLLIVTASYTNVTVTCDEIVVKTSGGQSYLVTTVNNSVNITSSGANGLDTGSVAASSTYDIYIAYNPTTTSTCCFFTREGNAPTLPSGYTAYARIGWQRTDSLSRLYNIQQWGDEWQYVVQASGNTVSMPVAATGPTPTAGWSYSPPADTLCSLAGLVPAKSIAADFILGGISNGGNQATIAPNAYYGSPQSWSLSNPPYATTGLNNGPTDCVTRVRLTFTSPPNIYIGIQVNGVVWVSGGKINI